MATSKPYWPHFLAGLVLILHSGPVFPVAPAFSNQTEAAGLTFVHGPASDTGARESTGGGTVGDFNRDGWPDLFVTGGGLVADALFLNNGDGTFTDRAAAWGLAHLHRGNGATAGDYDKDGWQDLYVTSQGDMAGLATTGQHRLYHNLGGTGFEEVAAAAGVALTALRPDGYGANFGDYDLDGDLDLWVAGWVFDLPALLRSRLFRNEGDGTFSDATYAANVDRTNQNLLGAFAGSFADMNGDGRPELLIAADAGGSLYYRNDGNGGFTAINIFAPDKVFNGMGQTVADFDRNGLLDWFVTAIYPAFGGIAAPGNRLYLNQGDDVFVAAPESAGIDDGGWGWGTAALDFDHDGWTDIVMTNGWLHPDDATGEAFDNEPAYLFRNNTDGSFTELGQAIGLDHRGQGRGLVHLDYDRDGDMDVVITSYNEPLALFRNDVSGANANWLEVFLDTSQRPALAPHGFGSAIRLRAGADEQYQQITGGSNYLGRSQLVAHFGLGTATTADEVTVTWADGAQTILTGLGANQILTVAPPADLDSDGADDAADTCLGVANSDQRDTDGDGIGNVCDADLNQDCLVNFLDLGLMKTVFFSADPDADLDGDGAVGFPDLGLLKSMFFADFTDVNPGAVPNLCGGPGL